MKAKLRVFAILLPLLIILGAVGAAGGYLYQALYVPNATAEESSVFEIRPGQGLRSVAEELQAQAYISSSLAFELYARFQGWEERLQAGRYLISDRMSSVEILEKIVSGDAVFDEMIITIPEGWSLADIELYFETLGLFSKEEFAQAAVMQDAYDDFWFLAPLQDDTILDGYLFPDTYRIFSNSTPISIVRRMLTNFGNRLSPQILETLETQDRTLHELLTLASIVQKEAPEGDMEEIAGVFWNRLRDGWNLESDATVNYVLGTKKLQPTFADTEVDDPYNTYRYPGLPPGPIGNPGMDAILAALDPAEHDYYFFLHKPTRETVFSRTFGEHLAAKRRYLD